MLISAAMIPVHFAIRMFILSTCLRVDARECRNVNMPYSTQPGCQPSALSRYLIGVANQLAVSDRPLCPQSPNVSPLPLEDPTPLSVSSLAAEWRSYSWPRITSLIAGGSSRFYRGNWPRGYPPRDSVARSSP